MGCGSRQDGSPRVWVLTDDRAGNTTQSLGLAEALGWPYERRRLVPGPLAVLHNRLLGASLSGIDLRRSDRLEPPWPDLVIAAGRRTAPVALWIRRASGDRTRLVQLGRKGGDYADLFDLVVTPGYCRLFPHPRRLEVRTALPRVRGDTLEAARERWRRRLAVHPEPRIGLLVGGTSGQYRLGPGEARRLAEAVARWAGETGGSVLATTSRRTGAAARRALRRTLAGVPGVFHEADAGGENPYLGFLAWADPLVVTADSESLLAEVASLGKPVYIHPLPVRASFRVFRVPREWVWLRATAGPQRGGPQRHLARLCTRLLELGLVRPSRDLSVLHEDLFHSGVARPFGDPGPVPTGPPLREAEAAARRVQQLLG
jgi:mitochondrial fission protein ELM1